jgi:hypothetical protein
VYLGLQVRHVLLERKIKYTVYLKKERERGGGVANRVTRDIRHYMGHVSASPHKHYARRDKKGE